MRQSAFKVLLDTITEKRFRNIGYLPRWIIFLIDVFIVFLASIVTYIILSSLIVLPHLNMPIRYAWMIMINAFCFFIFKTYSGIIRHSTFIDGVKLLASTSTAFGILVTINYTWYFVYGQKLYLTTGILIGYVMSFLMLFLFRTMVKDIFERYLNTGDNQKLIKAVIYGADANAIAVANALRAEVPLRFRLVGFIDRYGSTATSKRILNLPIVSQSRNIHVILRSMKAQALIIAEKGLTKEETIALVEECLEYNIKAYSVPIITDWEDEKQISNRVKSFEINDLLERQPIQLHMNNISSAHRRKKVLITGAAGSIGSEITRQVLGFAPDEIVMLDQAETPLHELVLEICTENTKVKCRPVLADIRNKEVLEKLFDTYRPHVVYHAAAYKHVPMMEDNPCQAVFTNVLGTKNLADLSRKYGVERFVMVSTDKAVNPSNVMGASKRIAEKYVQSLQYKFKKNPSETKFITTRFGNVLGSNGSIVPLFTRQIEQGGPVTITHPDIIRYFMTIPEACQLVLEAGTMGNGGEIFIFDMGKPVKIIDLATKMIRLAGYTPGKEIEIKIIGLRPGEKLYEELLNDTSQTLPTHNAKIMIAQDRVDDHEVLKEAIRDLVECARHIGNEDIVMRMKRMVPEFKSMNSVFENLDY